MAAELDIPVLGKMPTDAALAEAVEKERFFEVDHEYLSGADNQL